VEVRTGWDKISFPYVPGLLSFREAPLIISVFKTVEAVPDCIIFDGQGIAHPRRFGIASHVGLILGIPSIGCAKSRLYGLHEEPGSDCGSRSRLVDAHDQPIGVVLRTKKNVQPVFVSPGHLIGIEESADIIMECRDGYRIPAPTRLAHIRVGEYKRSMQSTWKA
jgi:deoxyribonuclease V